MFASKLGKGCWILVGLQGLFIGALDQAVCDNFVSLLNPILLGSHLRQGLHEN